jgi:hypothetical protein
MRGIAGWIVLVVCACDSGELPPPPPPLALPVVEPPPRVLVPDPATTVDSVYAELRVQIDDATTTGSLDAAHATRVIKSRAGLWRACFQKERNRVPALPLGTLVITARVDTNGTPLDVATSGFVDASFVSCVTSNFARLRFPNDAPGTLRDAMTYVLGDLDKQN